MRLLLALGFLVPFTIIVGARAQDVHVRVDPHGPGSIASTTDYVTIQQALDHHPFAPTGYRVVISIVPGTYRERIIVTQNHANITLLGLGASPEDVLITNSLNARTAGGTFFTETAEINGDAFEADNLTFENAAGRDMPNAGQAVAAAVRSDRAVFKHVRFLGDQDTLFADFGRQYYLDCYIAGGVDFIFGNATAVFDHSEIVEVGRGYLTAQSRTSPDQSTGYVITNSTVRWARPDDTPLTPGQVKMVQSAPRDKQLEGDGPRFFLGRPWRPYSRVVILNTELPAPLDPTGWSKWKPDDPTPLAFYAEFHNTGPGADTAHRSPWSHPLTPKEAVAYEPDVFLRGASAEQARWKPTAAAASLP